MLSDDPHVPAPREHELPNGDLAVSQHKPWTTHATTVADADRPLYRKLLNCLQRQEAHVPDLMPAQLAAVCDDLVDVRDTAMSYHGGSVDLPGGCYGMSYCHNVRDAIEAERPAPIRLIAVGCSSSKHDVDEPVRAADLYKGSYWSCKSDYGEALGLQWRIISAEHDLLHPDTRIDYYERTVSDLEGVPVDCNGLLPSGDSVATLLDRWALRVFEGLQGWLTEMSAGLNPPDVQLEILLGQRYNDPLADRGVFDALRLPTAADLDVSHPFREHDFRGNGDQMSWLSEQVADAPPDAGEPGRSDVSKRSTS